MVLATKCQRHFEIFIITDWKRKLLLKKYTQTFKNAILTIATEDWEQLIYILFLIYKDLMA